MKRICLFVTVVGRNFMSVCLILFSIFFKDVNLMKVWEPVKLFYVMGVLDPFTLYTIFL